MKSIRSLLLIGLLQVATATAAFAADDLAKIKSAGAFKVGTEGTYAPFTYHDSSNQLTGFDVDIARAIAAKLGVKAEFIEGKWDGLIAGLDANRYDAVINEVAVTDGLQRIDRSADVGPRRCDRQRLAVVPRLQEAQTGCEGEDRRHRYVVGQLGPLGRPDPQGQS